MNQAETRKTQAANEFARLMDIMTRLRKECPWDREQTHRSLRQYFIEETFEAVEAIDREDWPELSKELGDVLLQIVFHGTIGEEKGTFDHFEVIYAINEKLIRRHPHIFGETEADDAEAVRQNWEKIKKNSEGKKSYLDGVPIGMPALLRAQNLQRKAAGIGFDWDDIAPVWDKVKEETEEIHAAVDQNDLKAVEAEIGDMLFTWVNIARHMGINAEDALRQANEKFEGRFRQIESMARAESLDISQLGLEKLDAMWDKVKAQETDER